MRFKRSKRSQSTQPSSNPGDHWIHEELAIHHEALSRLQAGIPTLVRPMIDRVLERLLWMVWDLTWTDDAEPFSFFQRSLETATRALMAFEQTTRWWNCTPSLVQRHQLEPFWRAGVATAGLMAHVGRLRAVNVTLHTETTQGIEETWIPLETTLLAWLLRFQQGHALPIPTVRWETDSTRPSSAATTLMTHLILPGQVTRALTPIVTQALWDVLHGTAEETNVILEVLGQPVSQPPQYAPTLDASIPSASPHHLTDLVLSAMQNACVDGTLEVNRYPGQVFVREADTWVVVPKTLNIIRRWLRAKQVDLPANQVMYQSLQERGYLVGNAGQPIWKIRVPSAKQKTSVLQILRLRNDALWKEDVPPSFTETELTLIPQETAA